MASIIYYSHRSIDDLNESISIRDQTLRINEAHRGENDLDVNATFPRDEWQSIPKNRRKAIICLGTDAKCNQFVNRSSIPRTR